MVAARAGRVAGSANVARAGRAAAVPVAGWAKEGKAAQGVAEAGGREVAVQEVKVVEINMHVNFFGFLSQNCNTLINNRFQVT